MTKKNILIISYSFPPSNAPAAQRPYAFAKYLNKSKFNVTVLTCANQDSSMGISINTKVDIDKVSLIKVKSINLGGLREVKNASMKSSTEKKMSTLKSKIFKFLQWFIFPDKAVFWLFYVIPFLIKNKGKIKPDVIFSSSPLFTNHLIARFVKIFNKEAKHISDFRDYHYIENDNQIGLKGYFNKMLEKRILKRSDYVCFISQSMTEIYGNYYPKFKNKFRTIYNGFDSEEYIYSTNIPVNKKLTFFYAGSFYKGVRSPKPLLLILEYMLENNLISKSDFQIEIAGNFEKELEEELQKMEVYRNIYFLGLLPREEILKKYTESHVLWLIIGNKINHYTGIPIKMYEYIGSKRPILNFSVKNSEPEKIINDLNAGWSLINDENNIESKVKTILKIVEKFKSKKLNKPIDFIGVEKFLRKNQTLELEKILNE